MLAAPSVDALCALSVIEVESFNSTLITLAYGGGIVLLEFKLLVEGYIVRNVESSLLVGSLCSFHQIGIECVHLVYIEVFGADGSHNLVSCSRFRPVGKHRHEIGHAHWRNHFRAQPFRLGEEVEGKLVVAFYEVVLCVGEHHELRVEVIIRGQVCHVITIVFTDFLC